MPLGGLIRKGYLFKGRTLAELAAAVQAFLLDGEGNRTLDAELLAGDLPVAHIQPLLGVGQQKFGGVTRGGAQGEQHGNGEFLQHGFILVSLVFVKAESFQ